MVDRWVLGRGVGGPQPAETTGKPPENHFNFIASDYWLNNVVNSHRIWLHQVRLLRYYWIIHQLWIQIEAHFQPFAMKLSIVLPDIFGRDCRSHFFQQSSFFGQLKNCWFRWLFQCWKAPLSDILETLETLETADKVSQRPVIKKILKNE